MGTVTPIKSADAREAIAAHLGEQHMVCAAALVRTGLPAAELEAPLTVEIASRYGLDGYWRRVTTALVVAWCAGHDEVVLRAFAAWERFGCEECALAVAMGMSSCDRCAEVG